MEELLDAEIDEFDEDDNDENEEEDDGYDDDELHQIMLATTANLKQNKKEIKSSSNNSSLASSHMNKKQKVESNDTSTAEATEANATTTTATSTKYPNSFSRVRETEMSEEYIKENFPNYYQAKEKYGIIFELHANQMLYLPAGWFHEVFSSGSSSSDEPNSSVTNKKSKSEHGNLTNDSNTSTASSSIHMALNYWFHPPDGDSFDQPYQTNFWTQDWNTRQAKLI